MVDCKRPLNMMWKEKICPAIKIIRTQVVSQKLTTAKKTPEIKRTM